MATLEEVKKLLQDANEGTTPAVEIQQEMMLQNKKSMDGIVHAMDKITSGEVSLQITPDDEEKKKAEELEKKRLAAEKAEAERLAAIEEIRKILGDQFTFDQFVELRRRREESTKLKDAKGGKDKIQELDRPDSVATGLAAVVGALVGVVSGFISEIANQIKLISKFARGLLGEAKILTAIQNLFKIVRAYFGMAVNTVKAIFQENKLVKTIKSVFSGLMKPFKAAGEAFAALGKGFGAGGKMGKILKGVKNTFTAFRGFFAGIGKFFGKLLAPITVIMGLFETVTTSLDFVKKGMEKGENGIQLAISGIMGAFTGLANFFIDIVDIVKDGVSWIGKKIFGPENPVSKFLDSFSLKDMFTKLMLGITNFINHDLLGIFDKLIEGFKEDGKKIDAWAKVQGEKIKKMIDDAWQWVKDSVASVGDIFKKIDDWLTEQGAKVKKVIDDAWDTVKEAVDLVWTKIKNVVNDIIDVYKGIFDGIKTVFEGVLAFFSGDDSEEEEDKVQAAKDVFTKLKEKLVGMFEAIGKVFTDFLGLLGIDLSEVVPDVSAFITDAKNFLSDMVKNIIKFVKSKVSFLGGGDDEGEKDTTIDDLKSSGALTKAGKWDSGDAAIDESTLKTLTIAQIETLQAEYPDKGGYKKLHVQLREEVASRLVPAASKVGTGTVGTALNAAPEVPMVLQSAGNPAPSTGNIVGLGQESVGQSGTMNNAQASLNETKTVNYVSQSAGNNTVVNSDNSTSVVNTSVYNPAVSPAMDTSDRTTGSYRDYMSYR